MNKNRKNVNRPTPDRKTLLAWLETLSTETLLRFWKQIQTETGASTIRARRDAFARQLRAQGLYSKNTYLGDIVMRLQKMTPKP